MRQGQRLRRLSIIAVAGMLSACMVSGPPFPRQMPTLPILAHNYPSQLHDLSPFKKYHFHIRVPKDWKTLDTKISYEPDGRMPEDIAAFREPGEWMNDKNGKVGGEIAVTLMQYMPKADSGASTPDTWLRGVLLRNVPAYKLLQSADGPDSGSGAAADVLIRYASGEGPIISRMFAVPSFGGTRMVVVTCSVPEPAYARLAEACLVAGRSFQWALPEEEKDAPKGGAR